MSGLFRIQKVCSGNWNIYSNETNCWSDRKKDSPKPKRHIATGVDSQSES